MTLSMESEKMISELNDKLKSQEERLNRQEKIILDLTNKIENQRRQVNIPFLNINTGMGQKKFHISTNFKKI